MNRGSIKDMVKNGPEVSGELEFEIEKRNVLLPNISKGC
jgi:hypothetical protein